MVVEPGADVLPVGTAGGAMVPTRGVVLPGVGALRDCVASLRGWMKRDAVGQILAQGAPREVMADARVREVYMGIPVS